MPIEPLYDLHSEKQLLQQIAQGSEPAFRQLFDLYRIRLFSFILDFTHSATDAEELVQDTFVRLWESRLGLSEVDHPRAYIYRMARNNTLNWLAKAARNNQMMRQVWSNMQITGNITEDILDARESRQLIANALSGLSEKKQAIFRMSREQGMKHEEIADSLGLSRSTVKNSLVEILKYLKSSLAPRSLLLALLAGVLKYF